MQLVGGQYEQTYITQTIYSGTLYKSFDFFKVRKVVPNQASVPVEVYKPRPGIRE